MFSTITIAASSIIMSDIRLTTTVGQILIISLLIVLIGREYLPLLLKTDWLQQQKTLFLVKYISRIAVWPFLYVFLYIVIYNAVQVLR